MKMNFDYMSASIDKIKEQIEIWESDIAFNKRLIKRDKELLKKLKEKNDTRRPCIRSTMNFTIFSVGKKQEKVDFLKKRLVEMETEQ